MARNTRTFSDLDLNFTAHPVTKDLALKYDEQAVKSALKNLVLTNPFERPFHSEISSGVRALMFEPAGPLLNLVLQRTISDLVNNFEPRVVLLDVVVRDYPDQNSVFVRIDFKIVNTERPLNVEFTLERTR